MGAILGLTLGLGLLLLWQRSGREPRRRRPALARWSERRTDALRQAGVPGMGSTQLLGVQALAAVLGAVIVLVITDTAAIAGCCAVFGFLVPTALVRRLRRRRMIDLRDLWPEVVDNLASAVRAGLSLPEAVAGVGHRGPAPLRPAFEQFGADYRVSGRFIESLDRLKADLADPVADRICETLRVAREVGGSDLGTVLRALSAFLREDGRTRGELEARQSWTVSSARLAVAAPWLILVLLAGQSTTLTAYDSPLGIVVLGGGAAVCAVAYQIMIRIGRLPEERRVLR
ncbi:MAG: tight adherence protein [Mycobacteriales bacterium]